MKISLVKNELRIYNWVSNSIYFVRLFLFFIKKIFNISQYLLEEKTVINSDFIGLLAVLKLAFKSLIGRKINIYNKQNEFCNLPNATNHHFLRSILHT